VLGAAGAGACACVLTAGLITLFVLLSSCRYETTASALAFTVYALARHPDKMQKLVQVRLFPSQSFLCGTSSLDCYIPWRLSSLEARSCSKEEG
jgi:hypothetical protein